MFITFEGLDGSGKTTQLNLLAASLAAEGRRVVTLRNPGGTALGERIRAVLLDSKSERELGAIAPEAELALMFADRAQSLREVVLPALAEGAVVLCDRFTDSSEAYQGAGRGLGVERVLATHEAVCRDVWPQLTVLLLPPLEGALTRARKRNAKQVRRAVTQGGSTADENRFEREGDDFYRRVHEQYAAIARREEKRVVVFAEEASIEAIAERILEVVHSRF
jgi:dTMP kinase